ncbi:Phosphoribosyl transferase domain [seawater metagenome]|uniref:Phosphoribosyl transferase domain n=1 Tax=seawater metagenome TaxID=1561972 RepID=A0A5E8CGR1_9ZZZZ
MSKIILSYAQIEDLVEDLYSKLKNNFEPDIVIAIGSGGWLPARLINRFFKKEIESIRVYSYNDINNKQESIIDSEFSKINADYIQNKNLLIIDDINDTGATLGYVVEKIHNLVNLTSNICIGVLHDKIKDKKYDIEKDTRIKYFYSKKMEDIWIHYPWE